MTCSLQAARWSVRSLLQQRTLLLSVSCVLALGIGVNLAVFALLGAVLLDQPEGVESPEQVFRLRFRLQGATGQFETERIPFPLFTAALEATDQIDVAAEAVFQTGWGRGEASREISAVLVTNGYFRVLGVRAALGRLFSAEDEASGQALALLSHQVHQRYFAGDPSVLGRTCWIANRAYTIVGVLPPDFKGLEVEPADVWLPLRTSIGDVNPVGLPASSILFNPSVRPVRVIARPRAGASARQTERRMAEMLRAAAENGLVDDNILDLHLAPIRASRVQRDTFSLLSKWAAAIALATLLAACANVANLLLAHDLERTCDIAVHLHLGASRSDIWLRVLSESLVCAVIGGAVATGFTVLSLRAISEAIVGRDIPWQSFLGLPYLATLILSVLASTFLSGVPSAYHLAKMDIAAALKKVQGSPSSPWRKLRFGLVVLQLAVSTCLLLETGLFFMGVAEATRQSHLGFNPNNIIVAQLPGLRNLDRGRDWDLKELLRLSEWVGSKEAVVSVATTTNAPLQSALTVSAQALQNDSGPGEAFNLTGVSPGYFETMEIALKDGRGFVPSDSEQGPLVTVIGEAAATSLWSHRNPIGECLRIADSLDCARVVGVVSSAPGLGVFGDAVPQIYVPIEQMSRFPVMGGDTRALLARVRPGSYDQAEKQIRSLPAAPYIRVYALTELVDAQLKGWRLGLTLSGILGGISLLVAAAGSQGQLTFWLHSHSRELGLRVALGATPRNLLALVSKKAATLTAIGVAVGILVSICTSILTERFFGFVSNPIPAFLAAALIQLAVGQLCALQIGVRTLSVNPSDLLRVE